MTYELAEQLKDAGYPQGDWQIEKYSNRPKYQAYDAKVPTLSELIEACGDKIFSIQRDLGSGGWMASSSNGIFCGEGTPEEAVAKLWLALNKK